MAGGEPLIRKDVIDVASDFSNMIFPVFTNGTMIDDDYISIFNENRNLIPVVSIEGTGADTNKRRGLGVSEKIDSVISKLNEEDILFGASITVTKDNMATVLEDKFVADLRDKGCGVLFFIEYVPAQEGTESLVLNEEDLKSLKEQVDKFKASFNDMILLSFPGDEEAMGGCLASGRGFFHINPHGGAEPCPFSPYAKYNLRDSSMKEILSSEYFSDLHKIMAKAGGHTGGCVLFDREDEVQALFEES